MNGPLLSFDSALIADPLYLACELIAESDGSKKDFSMCLRAMKSSNWAFSKSEQREQALMAIWGRRQEKLSNTTAETSVVVPALRWDGQAITFNQDHDACSSTSESPIQPPSDHGGSPDMSFGEIGYAIDADNQVYSLSQMDMDTANLLSTDFKQSMTMPKDDQLPDSQLPSLLFDNQMNAFDMQSFPEMAVSDFLLHTGALENGERTPRNKATSIDTFTGADYFLQ